MTGRDRLGRRRQPAQHRGLRPLFPKLPPDVVTRAIRVAMSALLWERLDGLVATAAAPTRPRAIGQVLEPLLQSGVLEPRLRSARSAGSQRGVATHDLDITGPIETPDETDWLEWQIRKEQALVGLRAGNRTAPLLS